MSDTGKPAYTDESIETFAGLDHIRLRATGYIKERGVQGQIHTIWEMISNSVDEMVLVPGGGPIWIGILADRAHHRYQMFIRDQGRGIPSGKLIPAITVLHTSGKIRGNAYTASAGLFGVGAKVAPALSIDYRILSSNYLEDKVGDLYIHDGEIVTQQFPNVMAPQGVTIAFEFDFNHKPKPFFDEGAADEFMTVGYLNLVTLCKQYNVFNPQLGFEVYWYDRLLPNSFWTMDTTDAIHLMDDFIKVKERTVLYSAANVVDKSSYLFNEWWRTNSDVIWSDVFHKEMEDKLGFDLKLYFTRKSAIGYPQYFTCVNNVVMTNSSNSVNKTIINRLRAAISKHIEDPKYAKFVQEEYRFPTMLLAASVRYDGAELAGFTKEGFTDKNFEKQFDKEISALFSNIGEDQWKRCADNLLTDIQTTYSRFYDVPMTVSKGKKIFADLNFPQNYHECRGTGDDELFIVEGRSAGNIVSTRDNNFQAIYETRGKPHNAATMYEKMSENRKVLLKDPLYSDLIRILGVGPNTTDMSVARFKKIIIATDADPDGYHIATLHLNNLYIINPKLIESGMVWLAKPPLYSMNITNDTRLFLRDKLALDEALITYAYRPHLSVTIRTIAGEVGVDTLPADVWAKTEREMWYIVQHMGELFTQVSEQLDIPLLVLERLVYAIEWIYPVVCYDKLAEAFTSSDEPGFVRVFPDPANRSMVVSIGDKDHPIGLDAVQDTLMKHLMPEVIRYKTREVEFFVKSRHPGSDLYEGKPMTMMMLYTLMQVLAQRFEVSRYKGLGQMPPESCRNTIMNPATRSITQIISPGDPQYNYRLLGSKSDERKNLLSANSVALSHAFVRAQREDYL